MKTVAMMAFLPNQKVDAIAIHQRYDLFERLSPQQASNFFVYLKLSAVEISKVASLTPGHLCTKMDTYQQHSLLVI
jgi:hypothetical protein